MSELSVHDQTIFRDQNGTIINHNNLEREEQLDAYSFIPRNSTVIELGARYGTVSSIINKILIEPTHHLVVEPDPTVIPALLKNKEASGSQFIVFSGAVSSTPLSLSYNGYSTTTQQSTTGSVPTASLQELEVKYNLKFDALVADCEGCIETFIKENDISRFKVILLEQDNVCHCDYSKVENNLSKMGFVRVSHKMNIVYRSVYYNTNSLPFDLLTTKSEFGVGLFGKLGYVTKFENDYCTDVILDESNVFTISAHSPSTLKIKLKTPLTIRGYCSPTAVSPPEMTFICDGQIIGKLTAGREKTTEILLSEGEHSLDIVSLSNWAHAIWLLK